jgi:hypothetical protein
MKVNSVHGAFIGRRSLLSALKAIITILVVVIIPSSNTIPYTQAFSPSSAVFTTSKQCVTSSRLEAAISASEAVDILHKSQTNIVSKIASQIPDLAPKPDLSWTGATVNSNLSNLDGRDAPGPSNIAWLASVQVANQLSSLTIFNGPLTIVPHLLSRCLVNGDEQTMNLALDFRPRAYGAYEMKDENGNYPGPDVLGRDAFTYSGNRKEFESKFGTPEVEAFLQSTLASFEGAAVVDASARNEYEQMVAGPLLFQVTMPLTSGNVDAVAAARERAAEYWLQWALEDGHAHRPGAPINSQYVYDTKYRQNAFAALLPVYLDAFGEDGRSLTAAESGPLDEAYVGGAS